MNKLTDRQIETIRLSYAETGSQRQAARRAGCAVSSVKQYLVPVMDELEHIRTQKKIDIIEEIASVRLALLTAMGTPEKIAKASMQELATSFGILTDKHQILTGGATERTETGTYDPVSRLSADELEQLATIRDKLAVD